MKCVYISGPYSNKLNYRRQQNIHRAWEAACELWGVPGVYPYCPHTATANMDGACSLAHDEDYEKFITADLDQLGRCDAIYMLLGWDLSRGASRERNRAIDLGLPIFYQGFHTMTDLAEWARRPAAEPDTIINVEACS